MKQESPTSKSAVERINLYDLSPELLEPALRDAVSPPYRIRQIAEWLYGEGAASFESMSNLPRALREELNERFTLAAPAVEDRTSPAADLSQKYLFRVAGGELIESVYMPMGTRTTLCLSSQAGCAVGCTFCVTGFFGPGRNLSPSEMVGQYRILKSDHAIPSGQINVVFMGMGEPLLNLPNLLTTLDILYREISPKRITVSTSGITPGIEAMAQLPVRPNLALSVNAPDRERREQIMPITRKYPLEELIATLRNYPEERGREITAEYVLLEGFNDAPADARALARLLRGIKVKLNAIPFNPDPNLPAWMKRPSEARIDAFANTAVREGLPVTVRRSKGREIAAACGQLRGKTERRQRT
ncbi:MAG: 23S rRNA (adenine(2503)-C(2))-methyltransferase RlmN [Acidobacteriota bacterium]